MTSLGASIGLIGLSFFTFSLPVMLLSPFTGRYIDSQGGFAALVLGIAGVGISGLLYPLIPSIWFPVALGLFEGTAFAFASPALYMLVSRAAPAGRTSTAQGLFGAAGTMGTITASIVAGILATIDLRLPFLAAGSAILVTLVLGLAVGRRRLWSAMQPSHLDGGRAAATEANREPAAGAP
jgi:MFS family permease